jgi:hypothetical protein
LLFGPLELGPSRLDDDLHVVLLSRRYPDTSYFSYHMGHVFQTDSHGRSLWHSGSGRIALSWWLSTWTDPPASAPNRHPHASPQGSEVNLWSLLFNNLLPCLRPCSLTSRLQDILNPRADTRFSNLVWTKVWTFGFLMAQGGGIGNSPARPAMSAALGASEWLL